MGKSARAVNYARNFMDHFNWRRSLAKPSVKATCDCTCLGHLGRRDTDRIIYISLIRPRQVRKAISWTVSSKTIDIESLQNRLLKVCYVPATSASILRV